MSKFKVHILGCGSAAPDRRGNHGSCQCVECCGHNYLIDCGENAQYSLYRRRISYAKIDCIFISHMHGDHFLGLFGLISTIALTAQRKKPIEIFAPAGFEELVRPMLNTILKYISFELVFHVIDKANEVIYENDHFFVKTLPMNHKLEDTFGFLFQEHNKKRPIIPEKITEYDIPFHLINDIKSGADFVMEDGTVIENSELTQDPEELVSYAYCSDTFESPGLADSVSGVTVLYHETSFLEAEIENAIRYKHSTTRIAATVAKEAGAKKLYMGHISARYSKENDADFIREASAIFPDCYIATEETEIEI